MTKLTRKPAHIAIILDGNSRWAKNNLLPRKLGHLKGVENVKNIVNLCKNHGISYLTLYAFSLENWNRPSEEIEDLMNLLRKYLKTEINELIENNIQIRFIGNLNVLASDIMEACLDVQEKSKDGEMILTIALSYSGRDEINRAARRMAEKALIEKSTTNLQLEDFLDTKGLPDPDLLIRTGGDQRISNFLLWQIAYSELYFDNVNWPAFGEAEFTKALDYYASVERRFGARL